MYAYIYIYYTYIYIYIYTYILIVYHIVRVARTREPRGSRFSCAAGATGSSGVHKGGFRKGGFGNSTVMITRKSLNPPLRNPPL